MVKAVPIPGTGYAALGMAVPAGFSQDPTGAAGTAHLCEHVAMRLSATAGSPVVLGRTTCHATLFTTEALDDDLEAALAALAALRKPRPHIDDLVESERRAVDIELELARGGPLHGVGAAVAGALAPQTGLGAEYAAHPSQVNVGVVRRFLQEHYQTAMPRLVAAGEVDPVRLSELAAAHGLTSGMKSAAQAVPKSITGPVPATMCWGVAFTLDTDRIANACGWDSAMLSTLVGAQGIVSRICRAHGDPPAGSSVLQCDSAWLAVAAWTGDPRPATIAALRTPLPDLTESVRLVRAADAAERGALTVPTSARDALLAEAIGAGPDWRHLSEPFDPLAVAVAVRELLRSAILWRIRGEAIELLN